MSTRDWTDGHAEIAETGAECERAPRGRVSGPPPPPSQLAFGTRPTTRNPMTYRMGAIRMPPTTNGAQYATPA